MQIGTCVREPVGNAGTQKAAYSFTGELLVQAFNRHTKENER